MSNSSKKSTVLLSITAAAAFETKVKPAADVDSVVVTSVVVVVATSENTPTKYYR